MITKQDYHKKVAEVIRIEYDQVTGDLRIILNVIDDAFKQKVIHNKEYVDLIKIINKDVLEIGK